MTVKKHGRWAVSLFALGLAALRKIFSQKISEQVIAFLHALASPNLPPNPLIRLGF